MTQINLRATVYLRQMRLRRGSGIGGELASYQGAPAGGGRKENSTSSDLCRRPGGGDTALMDPDSTDEMVDHLVDFFDQVANDYDGWAQGQHRRVASRLVEIAKPKKGEHALDVATGTGLVANEVAAKVKPGTVIGIDLS